MEDNKKYDIIIPTAKKDLNFLPWAIKYAKKNLIGAERIFVITKKDNFNIAKKYLEKFEKKQANLRAKGKDNFSFEYHKYKEGEGNGEVLVDFIDENELVKGMNFSRIRELLSSKGIDPRWTGWYFQQFLKFGFAQSAYCRNYYLSWDSDTIALAPIYFIQEGKPMFTLKSEYHPSYFSTIKKMLGLEKQIEKSFIAESMLFKKDIMQEIIGIIQNLNKGKSWYENIIDSFNTEEKPGYFSEFETYGTYCMVKHRDLYGFQQLNTFRRAGMIRGRYIDDRLLNNLSVDIEIASFEAGEGPWWVKIRNMNFKRFLDSIAYRTKLKKIKN